MTKASEPKRKIEDIMREFNETLVEGILVFKDAIFSLCDNKRKEFNNSVTKVLKTEEKADLLKEELIEKFLKRETMAFSRSDRIQLIEEIDIIFDHIEYCIRSIQVHSSAIKDYATIAAPFKKFTTDLMEIIKTLSTAMNTAEEDLENAIQITKQVEKKRDVAKDQIFQMMKDIITSDYEIADKFLLYRSIEYLLTILEKTEETSDFLRTLAIKYLVLK